MEADDDVAFRGVGARHWPPRLAREWRRLIATFFTRVGEIYESPTLAEQVPSPHERNEMKKPSGPKTDESAHSVVDVVAIDRLAKIVAQYDLHEIEISLGDLRVRLARHLAPSAQTIVAAVPEMAAIAPRPRKGAPSLRLQPNRRSRISREQ